MQSEMDCAAKIQEECAALDAVLNKYTVVIGWRPPVEYVRKMIGSAEKLNTMTEAELTRAVLDVLSSPDFTREKVRIWERTQLPPPMTLKAKDKIVHLMNAAVPCSDDLDVCLRSMLSSFVADKSDSLAAVSRASEMSARRLVGALQRAIVTGRSQNSIAKLQEAARTAMIAQRDYGWIECTLCRGYFVPKNTGSFTLNCDHHFCKKCMVSFLTETSQTEPIRCPGCARVSGGAAVPDASSNQCCCCCSYAVPPAALSLVDPFLVNRAFMESKCHELSEKERIALMRLWANSQHLQLFYGRTDAPLIQCPRCNTYSTSAVGSRMCRCFNASCSFVFCRSCRNECISCTCDSTKN